MHRIHGVAPPAWPAPSSRRRRKEAWLQARVFNRLALVSGAVVSVDELAQAAYVMSPDGGPLGAIRLVRVTIHRLRQRGAPIKTVHGRGYVLLKDGALLPPGACRCKKQRCVPRRRGLPEEGEVTAPPI